MNAKPASIAEHQFDSGIRPCRIVADQGETRGRLTALRFSRQSLPDVHSKAALPPVEVAHRQLTSSAEFTDRQSAACCISDGLLPTPMLRQIHTSATLTHVTPRECTHATCTCLHPGGSIDLISGTGKMGSPDAYPVRGFQPPASSSKAYAAQKLIVPRVRTHSIVFGINLQPDQ